MFTAARLKGMQLPNEHKPLERHGRPMNPNAESGQLGNGVPGGFPLPQGGQKGTAYNMNKMHPAAIAALPPRQNPTNAAPAAVAAPAAGGAK